MADINDIVSSDDVQRIINLNNALQGTAKQSGAVNAENEKANNACKEPLEQPTQEPVATVAVDNIGNISVGWTKKPNHNDKLYTHPHQWQGLTDDEIDKIYFKEFDMWSSQVDIDFAHAIEQALKEKNHE